MRGHEPLGRIVAWSHRLVQEVLRPGDLAVDLTAGNGHDALFLFRCVGTIGRVVAFDIQETALHRTAERLLGAGARVKEWPPDHGALGETGVYLVPASHDRLAEVLCEAPRVVVANLGYLPGGDRSVATRKDATLAAVAAACDRLASGGRLVVVVYVGHAGGREEGEAVAGLLGSLPHRQWDVLRLETANRSGAPYLLVAERRCKAQQKANATGQEPGKVGG